MRSCYGRGEGKTRLEQAFRTTHDVVLLLMQNLLQGQVEVETAKDNQDCTHGRCAFILCVTGLQNTE